MTINEAFEHLTAKRGWYKLCKIDPDAARNLKRNYNEGKMREEYIRKLLQSANYMSVPEKWKVPKKQIKTDT